MLKTILAPLTGTDCDMPVLAASLRLANTCKGHIECVRIIRDLNAVATQIEQIGMAGWITLSDRLNELEREGTERTKSARASFASSCRKARIAIVSEPPGPDAVSISWREDTGEEMDRIIRASHYYDAVVLAGGEDRPGRLQEPVLEEIVIGSGRPVLLAPANGATGPFGTVAIAWKDTAEAARAVTAAMPLLTLARLVSVFSVEEAGEKPGECAAAHDAIVRYLHWHGLRVDGRIVTPGVRTAAEAVLDCARAAGADLLVMGGYGHSRLRELVFGGFTRQVLNGVGLPVFIFH